MQGVGTMALHAYGDETTAMYRLKPGASLHAIASPGLSPARLISAEATTAATDAAAREIANPSRPGH